MTAFEFVDNLPNGNEKFGNKPDPLIVEFAEALRSRPNSWAKYPRPTKSKGSIQALKWLINTGNDRAPKPFRGGGFEATARDGVMYVRYVGGVA